MRRRRALTLAGLARGYQRAEGAGLNDLLIGVVLLAGTLATLGIVLVAFMQTRATLAVALILLVAATVAVLVTIGAMLGGPARDGEER